MSSPPLSLRPLATSELAGTVALWNVTAGEAFPLREAVLRQAIELNPNHQPDDAVAAWQGDRLVGFGLLGRYRGDAIQAAGLRDRTALTIVAVHPDVQRQGIGTLLVDRLVERAGLTRATVHPGGGPFFLLPGPPRELPAARPFLESLGYSFGRTVHDLRADLTAPESNPLPDWEARLTERDCDARPCRSEDVPALLAFLAADFPGMWWHDADRYFAAGGDPADWLLLRQGVPVIGMVRLHHPASHPIGPASYWAPLGGPRAGGLGPIGVANARRGSGLGKLLLAATLAHLRRLGVDDAVADWTDLLGYYQPFGFRIWKSYDVAG
jgi:GNAT superfamily N-acetyltransferase